MNGVGEWKVAGSASISADGQQVSTDPGQGIPHFCGVCGLFATRCPPLPEGDPPPQCQAVATRHIEPSGRETLRRLNALFIVRRRPAEDMSL